MDHKELLKQIDTRFDKLEKKLDAALVKSTENETDLKWVKGYIKTSLTFMISLTIGLITTFFRTLKGE